MKASRKQKKRKATSESHIRMHSSTAARDRNKLLSERLLFEEILTDLSARLVSVRADRIKSTITYVLKAILDFFRVDRCMVIAVSPDKTRIGFSYVVSKRRLTPLPKIVLIQDSFPWTFQKVINQRKEIFIDAVSQLPREAVIDRKHYQKWGTKAVILMPLVVEENVEYLISISSHKAERTWPREYAPRLRLLGGIIASTLVRVKAEAALAGSEEKFRQFFEHIPEYAFIVTTEGKIIDVNPAALAAMGYNKNELVGKPLTSIYTPETHSKMRRLFAQWQRTGMIRDEEMVIVTKQGKRRTVLLNVGAVRNNIGKILHSTSVQTDITDRKRAQEELQQKTVELETMYEELKKFSEHLHEVREEERTGIAQELHDELGQALTALRMDISWIKKHPETNTAELTFKTDKMIHSIDTIIKKVQRISSDLRPGILDDLGLIPAVEWQCTEFQKQYGVKCSFTHEGSDLCGKPYATVLFRVLQESLTNIARHARAKNVYVKLRTDKTQTQMTISDNGRGIKQERIDARSAFGISCMRQRVSSLGGTFEIESAKRKGTTVRVTVPCGGDDNDSSTHC
jgi:PAS domain S-box-containing protein